MNTLPFIHLLNKPASFCVFMSLYDLYMSWTVVSNSLKQQTLILSFIGVFVQLVWKKRRFVAYLVTINYTYWQLVYGGGTDAFHFLRSVFLPDFSWFRWEWSGWGLFVKTKRSDSNVNVLREPHYQSQGHARLTWCRLKNGPTRKITSTNHKVDEINEQIQFVRFQVCLFGLIRSRM